MHICIMLLAPNLKGRGLYTLTSVYICPSIHPYGHGHLDYRDACTSVYDIIHQDPVPCGDDARQRYFLVKPKMAASLPYWRTPCLVNVYGTPPWDRIPLRSQSNQTQSLMCRAVYMHQASHSILCHHEESSSR